MTGLLLKQMLKEGRQLMRHKEKMALYKPREEAGPDPSLPAEKEPPRRHHDGGYPASGSGRQLPALEALSFWHFVEQP